MARFKEMELQAARSGRRLADVPRDEMEALWDAAKARAASTALPGRAQGSKAR